jgi:hypothetical protein
MDHVASGFGQNHGSGFGGDARDRLQQLVLALPYLVLCGAGN